MSVKTKEKREQRANLWGQMKTILESAEGESRSLTAEERQKWDQLEAELDTLKREIEFDEKVEQRKHEMERPERERILESKEESRELLQADPGDDEDAKRSYGIAFRKWMTGGILGLEAEERQILQRGFKTGPEYRALSAGTGTAGGYTVPQGFRARIQEAMKFFGGVRSVAEVIDTDSGNDLPWPTNDDTANKGAILAENTQVTEQDLVLAQKTLKAHMYTSKLIRVSYQLLQDSAFDLENWLSRKLSERIARAQNEHFTTGTGTAQPEGIQTNATVAVTGATGQTTTVTYADIVDLVYSVDAAYRAGGRAGFMMNDATIGKVRRMVDTQGRPIWEVNVQAGQPDQILGWGVTANNDMPAMASNVKSILFGDFFAGYVIRDVSDFQLLRLEERYADFLQVGFLGFQRSDGLPQDTTAYKAYRNSAA